MSIESRLIVASNRLPFTVHNEAGDLALRPACGGLAAALGSVHHRADHLWVGWPGDCDTLTDAQRADLDARLLAERVVPVSLDRTELVPYYDGICNSILWPVLHYLVDRLPMDFPDFQMYRAVNERFADTILGEYRQGDIIWVHDYHLLLAPALIRQRLPQAPIGFFLHTPFPAADVFRVLPWRRELLDGVLGATLLGFQTDRDARNFADAVATLTEYGVHGDRAIVDGREVRFGSYPIGIDPLRLQSSAPRSRQAAVEAPPVLSGTIKRFLGVDRLDYTKGIPRRLAAFERLLEENPSLLGQVELLQVAVPSRAQVASYVALKQEVDALVDSINARFSTPSWQPVQYIAEALDPEDLAALYRSADVMLVTSLRDGMNLVAKEFVLARADDDGVLILSELAGAAGELHEALTINPYSVEQVASAMATALLLDRDERRRRMRALRRGIAGRTVESWVERFTAELMRATDTEASALDRLLPAAARGLATGEECTVVVVYEGVLVPDHDYVEALCPDPEVITLLTTLALRPGVALHVVCGVDHDTLGRWFDAVPVTLWAKHGLWRREPDGRRWRRTQWFSTDWLEDVRELLNQFAERSPGAFVEERGSSLIWNYARAERLHGHTQAQILGALLREGCDALGFMVSETDRTIEVRPAGLTIERTLEKLLDSRSAAGPVILIDRPRPGGQLRSVLSPEDVVVTVGAGAAGSDASVSDPRAVRTLLWELAGALAPVTIDRLATLETRQAAAS